MQPTTATQHNRMPVQTRTERTCAGCGLRDVPAHMIRIVADSEGQIAIDLAGHCWGRGAHVHPSPACLSKAARRGLAASLRRPVHCDTQALVQLIVQAADRRIRGLLASAVRAGAVVAGHDAVEQGLERAEIALVVVATDALGAAHHKTVQQAVGRGMAVAWGTKADLGTWLRRQEMAVLGVRSPQLGAAIAAACRIADGARSGAEDR